MKGERVGICEGSKYVGMQGECCASMVLGADLAKEALMCNEKILYIRHK